MHSLNKRNRHHYAADQHQHNETLLNEFDAWMEGGQTTKKQCPGPHVDTNPIASSEIVKPAAQVGFPSGSCSHKQHGTDDIILQKPIQVAGDVHASSSGGSSNQIHVVDHNYNSVRHPVHGDAGSTTCTSTVGEALTNESHQTNQNDAPTSYSSESDEEGYVILGEDDLRSQNGLSVQDKDADIHFVSVDMQRLKRGDTRQPIDLGAPTFNYSYCGAMFWYEERTQKHYRPSDPKFNLCCKGGIVKLPMLRESPPFLKELMDYEGGPQSRNFRANIRQANCIYNFTSFGVNIDRKVTDHPGLYCFRIFGETYHFMGSLVPPEGDRPKFGQLYVVDTASEVDNRLQAMHTSEFDDPIHRETVQALKQMFDAENKLVKFYRKARDAFESHPEVGFQLKLLAPFKGDNQQYAPGECPEVVGLIVGDEHELANGFEIVVQHKSGLLQKIDMLHPSYMALQYPILFPWGEDGYNDEMKLTFNSPVGSRGRCKTKRDHLSMLRYYCFRIQQRAHETSRLLRGGKLFHQFLVDAYTCIEQQRLNFCRFHQKDLRAALYQGLSDAFDRGDTETSNVGRRIILPSSFTGGPRYMQQNYQDAMAICRTFGNPDLFITFTCNAKWKEFDEALKLIPGQKIPDRPDLIARVFKMKLDAFMKYLKEQKFFGKIDAVIYTVEFQKRGLPHAHIVLWLDPRDKPQTAAHINKFISAEIPDARPDRKGYEACRAFMIHGPCGLLNPRCPCMRKGTCSKNYPKEFSEETVINGQGFSEYRRRNTGITVERNGQQLDNRHVVPHNLDLVLKFVAHINVEWCNKSEAIKYLFKYITKGSDRIRAEIRRKGKCASDQVDEIQNFVDCRYLSAIEACWRIFEFDINYSEPAVQRLQYHLKDQQHVVFPEEEELSVVLENARGKDTMLTAWFKANQAYPHARQLTYVDFPTQWVWESNSVWKPRKKGRSIGRIYYAHPASEERFYMRILINVVKGCTSFEDIRTYNGTTYNTYREACQARGLIGDDDEWRQALEENYSWGSGGQMRDLFMTIILYCDVANPMRLWQDTWRLLADDIIYNRRTFLQAPHLSMDDAEIQELILVELDILFRQNGTSLRKKNLPKPKQKSGHHAGNRLLNEELQYDKAEQANEHTTLFSTLNADQKHAYEQIIDSVAHDKGKLFFVYGQGGTGKTHLWKALLAKYRSQGQPAIGVASSGIAALLIPGGRTAHSRFKIPFDCQENSTCGIEPNSKLAELIREARLLIWDEAPMDHRHCFEALDRTLRDVMLAVNQDAKSMVFGGKTVVLGGDFRQVLPVIEKGDRIETVRSSVNRSKLWDHCEVLTLRKNMRLSAIGLSPIQKHELDEFAKWLLSVGDGSIPAIKIGDDDDPDWIKVPCDILLPARNGDVSTLLDEIFPDFSKNIADRTFLRERAILAPTNAIVDEINDTLIDQIASPSIEYLSFDSICASSTNYLKQVELYPLDYLNSLQFNGLPPHKLTLKVGAPVMLIRNLNQERGLCNGTRLIVRKLGQRIIEAEILTGQHAGELCAIPRITLSPPSSKLPFIFKRRQFPLRLSCALTINKAQGQTLKMVGLFLPQPVFSHGQLYVALSRVQSKSGLRILIDHKDGERAGYTKNIVYKEVYAPLDHAMESGQ